MNVGGQSGSGDSTAGGAPARAIAIAVRSGAHPVVAAGLGARVPAPAASTSLWNFHGRPTPFVGRLKELHRLREAVRTAVESNRRLALLITGPAGIGKSRLLHAFTETLDEHVDHARVVAVACRPDLGPPFQLFARLLRRRFEVSASLPRRPMRDAIAAGMLSVLGAGAEPLVHAVCALIGLPMPGTEVPGPSESLDSHGATEAAVEGLARLLTIDAQQRPLVVCIDNLHLARDESLLLLSRVAQRVVDAPLVFLGAGRADEREAFRTFMTHLRRAGEVLALPALSDREGERVIAALLEPAGTVPEPFMRMTLEKAFGNPLSIEQIVQLQIERGAVEVRGDRWLVHVDRLDDTRIPGSLRDVVRQKLAKLSVADRAVLEKAAAVGEVFYVGCLDVLRRLDEGLNWDESDQYWSSARKSEELAAVLEGLHRRHIVQRLVESPLPGTRAYTFRHTIEREVLYEAIEGPRRARYHRHIARWLETHSQGSEQAPVEQIALHWERGHHRAKAARAYIEAGERALVQHANPDALTFYTKALGCLADDEARERLEVFSALGRVRLILGEYSDALGCFQEMLRLAWLLDNARSGGIAYNNMGKAFRGLGEYDAALMHLKHALTLFRRVEDVRGLASAADDIGRVHRLRGRLDLAEERIREGLRLREYLGDERSTAVSMHHLGNIHTERGQFKEAAQLLRDALILARKVDDRRTVADVLISTGAICYHRGQFEQALTVWREALKLAEEVGDRQQQGVLFNNLGATLLKVDRLDEAHDRLAAACALLEELGDRRSLSDALRNQAEVCLRQSDFARALDLATRALEAATEVGARGQAGLASRTLGEVCSRTLFDEGPGREARIAAAEEHFSRSVDDLSAVGYEAERAQTLFTFGAFLAEAGRVEDARERLQAAEAVYARLDLADGLERTRRILGAL